MNQSTRKLTTAHKVLHLRDGIDRFYMSRKEGGKRLARIEVCVDTIHKLEEYIAILTEMIQGPIEKYQSNNL